MKTLYQVVMLLKTLPSIVVEVIRKNGFHLYSFVVFKHMVMATWHFSGMYLETVKEHEYKCDKSDKGCCE